jgi:hypothetical protein
MAAVVAVASGRERSANVGPQRDDRIGKSIKRQRREETSVGGIGILAAGQRGALDLEFGSVQQAVDQLWAATDVRELEIDLARDAPPMIIRPPQAW